jgi:hypothetical protein
MLTYSHKGTRKAVPTDLLHQYNTEVEGFLLQIVMGQNRTHHFEPESKQQLMEWCHILSPKKKLERVPSAGKIIVTVFLDEKDVILVNFFPTGTK